MNLIMGKSSLKLGEVDQEAYIVNINHSNSANKLKGELVVPPSKSISHRAVICAALSKGESIINNLILSEDIETTIEAMKQFGAQIEIQYIDKTGRFRAIISNSKIDDLLKSEDLQGEQPIEVYCRESGSTARFLIPFFHIYNGPVTFKGTERLSERPYAPYLEIFDLQNIKYISHNGGLPLTVEGKLQPGTYNVVGNVSSQFISGLMFMLPLLKHNSQILIKPPLESKDYIALTVDCLDTFGIKITEIEPLKYEVNGGQAYIGTDYTVEGDYSQAAFWLVANALGSEINLLGVHPHSKQADRAIKDIIKQIDKYCENNELCLIDVSQCPDLVPIIAVYCALKKGNFQIVNAQRLRIKESDRLKAIATELLKMGADISETEDGLLINGVVSLVGAQVNSWNDHRIAMALAVAATCASGQTIITDAQCVRKSYPSFWEDYIMLGGDVDVK